LENLLNLETKGANQIQVALVQGLLACDLREDLGGFVGRIDQLVAIDAADFNLYGIWCVAHSVLRSLVVATTP